jgi:hypothetical protein
MLSAKIRIWLSKDQSVIRENVTPAEAAYYIAEHQHNVGKNPVEVIGEPEEIKRSSIVEIKRLMSFLPNKKVKQLFATPTASTPETFEEAFELGGAIEREDGELFTQDLAKE